MLSSNSKFYGQYGYYKPYIQNLKATVINKPDFNWITYYDGDCSKFITSNSILWGLQQKYKPDFNHQSFIFFFINGKFIGYAGQFATYVNCNLENRKQLSKFYWNNDIFTNIFIMNRIRLNSVELSSEYLHSGFKAITQGLVEMIKSKQ